MPNIAQKYIKAKQIICFAVIRAEKPTTSITVLAKYANDVNVKLEFTSGYSVGFCRKTAIRQTAINFQDSIILDNAQEIVVVCVKEYKEGGSHA